MAKKKEKQNIIKGKQPLSLSCLFIKKKKTKTKN